MEKSHPEQMFSCTESDVTTHNSFSNNSANKGESQDARYSPTSESINSNYPKNRGTTEASVNENHIVGEHRTNVLTTGDHHETPGSTVPFQAKGQSKKNTSYETNNFRYRNNYDHTGHAYYTNRGRVKTDRGKNFGNNSHLVNQKFDLSSSSVDSKANNSSVPTSSTSGSSKTDRNHHYSNSGNQDDISRGQVVGGRYIRQNHIRSGPSKSAAAASSYNSGQNAFENQYRVVQNQDGYQMQSHAPFSSDDLCFPETLAANSTEGYYTRNVGKGMLNSVPKHQKGFYKKERYESNSFSKTQRNANISNSTRKGNYNGTSMIETTYSGNEISKDNSKTLNELQSEHFENDIDKRKDKKFASNRNQFKKNQANYKEDKATQKDRLIHQLQKGECECMVCCENIKLRDHTWNCSSCYHVFHLRCIRKWARSPAAIIEGAGWRCPTCQNVTKDVPYNYFCFCGKCREPEINLHCTPHSCGEVCNKQRDDENCPHKCNLLCHPGPCPPCSAIVTRSCECGKTKKPVQCSQATAITCDSICDKTLNCGSHKCTNNCHTGNCQPCTIVLNQECFCDKNKREVACSTETAKCANFSCGLICGRILSCGHHTCTSLCHPSSCSACSLSPEAITSCPCGKTSLQELYTNGKGKLRITCIDAIPVCGGKCERILNCGPKDNSHNCNADCHLGDCPPCPLITTIKCRCGSTMKDLPCVEAVLLSEFLCEKRCNKRKDCGRHKCLNHCCVNVVHKCELVCSKKLSCGTHFCQETCHMGNCHTCWNIDFDELRCLCGKNVIYPPIQCGTKPPECNQPCTRNHACEHKVQHSCHSDVSCPPCTTLTKKWCFGNHEQRSNVQCFLDGISCGKPCGKPLPCGSHECQEICHLGPCLKGDEKCKQPCTRPRSLCGHPCAAACHDEPCPQTPCRAKMNVSCPCGHRSDNTNCSDNSEAYHLMSVSMLASKMQDIKAGESVNIGDILGKKYKYNRLQCNEECAVIERNKRLAVALQIKNPDLSCKPGPPNYSEFLKEEAKKNPKFVEDIYNKFCELVQLAKQSIKKSRSHSFPPMNRDQRRVVHELAEFFGCETQSYDQEPVKNVLITAFREKSWLPFASIMTVVQRDMRLRKGPSPVISYRNSKPAAPASIVDKKEPVIDYFDYS